MLSSVQLWETLPIILLVIRKVQLPEKDVWRLFDLAELTSADSLEAYLQAAVDRCTAWFCASGASLFIANQEPRVFKLAASAGAQSSLPQDASVKLGEGIAGIAIEQGQPKLLGDPGKDPVFGKLRIVQRKDVRSSMIVPLRMFDGTPVGVLNVSRGASEPPFNEKDLDQAEGIGRQMALAVGNAVLFSQALNAKKSAEALHERLSTVVAVVAFGVVVIDGDGLVTELNNRAVEFFGSDSKSGQGWKSVLRGVASALGQATELVLHEALRGKPYHARAADAQQGRSWVIYGSPLQDGGAVIAIEEVTETEKTQRELARVQRLAEIGQMTATIAHEIRNPLTGIRSAAQMIISNPEMAPELAKIIEEETIKLSELCTGFLDFARPVSLNLLPVKLGEIARLAVDRHRADFAMAGVGLYLEVDQDDPSIQADPLRIEQAIRNLLINALQACKAEQRVWIRVRGGKIEIEDNGAGMDHETQTKLFAPFFTTKTNGTGLGLCNVRKIIDAHGGILDVQSTPGKGTKFELDLSSRRIA